MEVHCLDELSHFSRAVWGNSQAVLKRHSPQENIEFIDIGDYFLAFAIFSSGLVKPHKILVREEYRTAIEELQTESYKNGAYVTGQSGKTYFLIYALVYFLGKKQPVALQLGGHAFYALFNDGFVAFHPFTNMRPLYKCNFIWALSDSNATIEHPPDKFMGAVNRVRVIQATSPEASRWKTWSKQMGASRYIMDIWSDEEVADLATLMGLNTERMFTLAKRRGSIPRTLVDYINRKDPQIEAWYREKAYTAIEKCSTMMSGVTDFNLSDDAPESFYFIRPRKTDTGEIDRTLAYVCVPTPTLRHYLAEVLCKQSNAIRLHFYTALSQRAVTHPAAGYIYENWFHSFFSSGNPITCQWIKNRRVTRSQLPTKVQGPPNIVSSTIDTLKKQRPPYYWPAPPNFPGIDSAFVLEKQIFFFQVMIGTRHKSPIDSLRKARDCLPYDLRMVPWSVVFVSPEENRIEMVAAYWGRELYFPSSGGNIAIAWSAVDPAADVTVAYRVYRDVPASDSEEETMEVGGA